MWGKRHKCNKVGRRLVASIVHKEAKDNLLNLGRCSGMNNPECPYFQCALEIVIIKKRNGRAVCLYL